MSLAGCKGPQDTKAISETIVSASPAVGAAASLPTTSSQLRYSLGIVGYNYTNTAIVDYSVNGTGAFNLGVSTEDSGGGSTVCCFGWAPAAKLPLPVQIEWTRDEKTWCRQTVLLYRPGPPEPTTFEVHFFPDRHIELAITDNYSPPILKLAAAGRDYRIGTNVRKEEDEDLRKDAIGAECRAGRFPIGVSGEPRERKVTR